MFARPSTPGRTLLLPNGKYLLFFGTDTLTDQRTGAMTRYLPNGMLDTSFSFSRAYTFVGAAASATNGKLIIDATRFLYGSETQQILRLNGDGSIDPSFNIPVVAAGFGIVRAIVIQPDGKILIAGFFDTFSGLARQKIVRLLADGTVDSSFTPPQFEGNGIWTRPVVLANGKILIAGDFTSVNGAANLGVARLNVDGSVDSTFQATGFNRDFTPIRGMVVQSDGKIVLAGRFEFGTGSEATSAPAVQTRATPM
ncbi:MAG: delta-60 repeat domain-containing protein [Blastocatellia bacterium]|nr:delta-60 repeat domain-containing protein [Blastocatellia bacterium]